MKSKAAILRFLQLWNPWKNPPKVCIARDCTEFGRWMIMAREHDDKLSMSCVVTLSRSVHLPSFDLSYLPAQLNNDVMTSATRFKDYEILSWGRKYSDRMQKLFRQPPH